MATKSRATIGWLAANWCVRVLTAVAAIGGFMTSASGATYVYTPTTVSETWSTGNNWTGSAAPSSGTTTELTFVGTNSTVLTNSLANSNTNNLSGAFQLNILNLQGTGPASGAGAITIANASPATGLSLVNSGTLPVVNLNANNGVAALTYTVSTPIALTNNTTFTGNGTATFLFSGALSGAGTLTKSGSSTLTIGNGNSGYTKDIFITAGTVAVANASTQTLGTGVIHLQGTGILSTNTDNVERTVGNTVSVESATAQFLLPASVNSLTLSGNLSLGTYAVNANNLSAGLILTGSVSTSSALVKNGLSTLITKFSAAQSFTGGLVINQRLLTVDYANMAGANMFNSANTLSFGSGAGTTFQMLGRAAGASSQSLSGMNLSNPGMFAIVANGVGGGKAVLNLGNVTTNRAAGAAVNVQLPTVVATQDATNGITTTSANTATSILGGWATVGQADWAVSAGNGVAAGNITALAAYTASVSGTTAPGASADVDVQTSNTAAWSSQTINSLRFNLAGANTLTVAGGETLKISSGGILNPIGAATNANTITGGSIAGSASGELIINNFAVPVPAGSGGTFTVASNIVDNGGPTALTINSTFNLAPGSSSSRVSITTLSGNNTYTGATYISGVASTLNLNSATGYAINGNGNVIISGGASAFTITQQKANQFAPNSLVTFAGSGLATLSLNGFNLTLAGLNGGSQIVIDNTTAATLTLNTAAGVTSSFAGRLRRSATTLVVSGLGTQIITNGTNDIGAISVTGGTLAGNSTMTSTVSVGTSGKLRAGTGTGTGETLTISNNLTVASGGMLEFVLGASGADTKLARTGGTWTFDPSQQVSIVDLGATADTDYTLITGLSTASINVSGWTVVQPSYPGYSFSSSSNSVFLHLTGVPEPSSMALLMLGAVPLTRRRLRQRA